MLIPDSPKEEQSRRQSLRDLDIVETPAQVRCERLTRLARQMFDVPAALVQLVDGERGAASLASELREALLEFAPHVHAAPPGEVFVVENALEDPRFRNNPLVAGAPHVRFFAGCRLEMEPGMAFGTFCILDVAPRRFSGEEAYQLRDLARMAERELIAFAYRTCEMRGNTTNAAGRTSAQDDADT
jgi:GAF domain-containing protein